MADTDFVDDFIIHELAFPQASVIRLHLFDSSEPDVRATTRPVRMSTATARRLAKALIFAADDLEGVDRTRQ